MLLPRRCTSGGMTRGLAGDQLGVAVGFLSPSDLGAPFNGGTILIGQQFDTPDLYLPGINNTMIIGSHAGGTVRVLLLTVDPLNTATVLFTDLVGAFVASTWRANIYATTGTRNGDPVLISRLQFQHNAGADITNLTVRWWGSVR